MKRTYISGTEKYCTRKRHIAAPLLRKKFTLQKQNITAAKIEISAVGLYRLFLNGKEITKGFFAPYISNPEQVVYYDEYDVRDLLKSQNIVCIILGNGFSNAMDCGIWDFENAAFRAAPKVYLALYIDGEQVLTTDETFEVIESPITFDDLRAGERYDARKEADDIFTKDCIEGAGKPYVAKTPEGIYKKCEAQPVKAFETYGPVSITKSENGFLYDFGRNNAGVYKLRVNGKYGQKITLNFGELIKDGKIDFSNIAFAGRSRKNYVQHDEYICKEGIQEYMPSFTYHGYRYVYVKGITEEQAPNLLEYIVLHSDIPRTGQFSCSSEMLNKIYQCTLASDLANFYYFPTDCPQREKNGWTGDVMLSAEQLLYTFDCAASMREWLYNVRMAQRPNGSLPGIVPTMGWGYDNGMNGPAWDGALIETTYQLYCFSGNKQIIQENFEAIRLYITFLKSKINANGLLQFGLGDWCEVGCYENPSTSNEVTDTLTAINLLNKTEKMFANIGDQERCNETKSFRTSLTGKFKEKYVVQGKVQCATQTAQAMAIENGIFSAEELPSAYAYLRELLFAKDDKFKVGVLGAKDLFGALTAGGMQDIAYNAVVGPEFPSYGYWIEHGATTLWEDFQEITGSGGYVKRKDKRPMNSLNHHFWGSVIAWFYKDIAGLNIVSHNEAQISPKIIAKLNWAEAQYANGPQKIKVRWDRETNGDILLKIKNNFFTGFIKVYGYHCCGMERVSLRLGEYNLIFKKYGNIKKF